MLDYTPMFEILFHREENDSEMIFHIKNKSELQNGCLKYATLTGSQ